MSDPPKKKKNVYYNTPFFNKKTKLLPGNEYCPDCKGTCIKDNAFCTNCQNGQIPIQKLTQNK